MIMSPIEINEKHYTPVVRLSAEIPRVNLEVLQEHLRKNGHQADFTNPECPDRLIVIWRDKKLMVRSGRIETITTLTLKERIKEDIRKFVNDELEWPKFKKEVGIE